MTTDIEKSLKAKLRTIAKEKHRDPADLWQGLVLERFLMRLAKSRHRQHFVLKGGVLLSKYIAIGRETTDLDFLALNISNRIDDLGIVFEEIVATDIADGFTFGEVVVNELSHPHMAYAGIEVGIIAYFGRVRFRVAIDVGFGDIVKPINKTLSLTDSLKGPLFEENVTLACYPKEFIFAEKLETVVYRGALNSRMKDFHDLYTMVTSPDLSFDGLSGIIRSVFEHRKTTFDLPLSYSDEQIAQLQVFWGSYLRGVQEQNDQILPRDISQVIEALNEWLLAHIALN